MKTRKWYMLIGWLVIALIILSCNIGRQANVPKTASTMVIETFTALTAEGATSQAAITPTFTLTPAPLQPIPQYPVQ